MKILILPPKCCGAGLCVMNAPKVFDQNESDGIVRLLVEQPPPDEYDNIRRAADICPTRAIEIVEAG